MVGEPLEAARERPPALGRYARRAAFAHPAALASGELPQIVTIQQCPFTPGNFSQIVSGVTR
jgi:hypothetical protein